MKKYLALALSLVLMFGVLASCGGGESSDSAEGTQVGIILPTKDQPRWIQDEESFRSALENAGFTAEVMFSQGSTNTELSNVEALLDENIKVLVICAQDAGAAGKAVKEAKDAGVTVVCYDRLITGTDAVDYYVTFDSYEVGVKQGQYLIDKFADKKDVPLYLYAGDVSDYNSYLLFSGAWSVLGKAVADGQFKVKNCPAVEAFAGKELDAEANRTDLDKILRTIPTDWDANKAATLAQANLSARKPEDKGNVAILAPNDDTARAIADVFAEDDDVSAYVITGQDAELASLKYIQDGKQSMTVWKDTSTLAKAACDLAGKIINGESPETSTEYDNEIKKVPTVVEGVTTVDAESLKQLIDDGSFSQEEIDDAK